MEDSKVRFSNRVEDYKKYRPAYPLEALSFVKTLCQVDTHWKIADIGSGTGISSNAILNAFHCKVFAVEPNDLMRYEAETILSPIPGFYSIKGSSEDTTLDDNSINMITAFQAYHWFDKEKSKKEFKRIITEPGWLLLVWNDRKTEGTEFLERYEKITRALPEYTKASHKKISIEEIQLFSGNTEVQYAEFSNIQKFDFEGLKGRFFSSSYTPAKGTPEHQIQVDKLKNLFDQTNTGGTIEFVYRTQLYLCKFL